MLQSRRGFLIGAGPVLTTAFVKHARRFIHRTSQPLLASPPFQHLPSTASSRWRAFWLDIKPECHGSCYVE